MDGDLRALNAATLEAERRALRQRRLAVFDYQPSSKEAVVALAAPGTVTLYLGRRGEPMLRQIAETAMRKGRDDARLALKIREGLERRERQRMSVPEAVDLLVKQPVFADLRYGGKTVASHLFVPDDMDIVSVVMPYNGGRLARGGFTLVEHIAEGSHAALTGLLVRAAPPLTRAEAVALSLVPSSQLEANVGVALGGAEDEDNLALTLVTLAALAAGVALAAAAEVAVPVAVTAEAAGIGIADVIAGLGIGGAVDAALDAAAAWVTAGDATVTTITGLAVANGDGDATAEDAYVLVADAGDGAGAEGDAEGDVGPGAGEIGPGGDDGLIFTVGDVGGDLIVGDVGAGDAGDAGAGDAGAGDAGAGDAGAGDAGAGDAGAGDAGAGAGDAGAGDAGDAGDAGAGDAGDAGDAGAGDAGDGGSSFAQRLVQYAAAEAAIVGLEIDQVLAGKSAEVSEFRGLAAKLRPAATARALLAARREALTKGAQR